MSFAIVTDTSCNLSESLIDQYDLHILPLTFIIDGEEYRSYLKGKTTDLTTFYAKMREGKVIATSLPNLEESSETLQALLEGGHDILYIGFSSGLSGTYQAISMLLAELAENYPERNVASVDTLAASGGEGLLVLNAARMRNAGASMQEVVTWLEENKLHLAHWFTVDDLEYLFRGGRVSRTSAWAASLLNIKPILHVDNEGHLIPLEKVRGRKKSLKTLVDHMKQTHLPLEGQTIFITHGDCLEDAEYLADLVKEEFGVEDIMINCIDPVIGAHSGPGTMALFFLASER
jgi:DegV family protein with EDD domain